MDHQFNFEEGFQEIPERKLITAQQINELEQIFDKGNLVKLTMFYIDNI